MTFVFPVTSTTSSKQFRVSSGPPPAKKMKMTNSPRFEFNESPVRTFFPLHKPTPSALSKPDYKHTKNAMKNMSPSDLLRFVHTNPDYAMTAERIFKKICLNQITNLDPALAASTWRQTYINLSERMEH